MKNIKGIKQDSTFSYLDIQLSKIDASNFTKHMP